MKRVLILAGLCVGTLVMAQEVPVRLREASSHGYLVLKDSKGGIIASGEQTQVSRGTRLESRLVFRFKDGSIDDESTTWSQDGGFRLISDHHLQHGPSFPKALDMSIDVATKQVSFVRDGSKETKIEHVDMPTSLSNGIFLTLIRNLKLPISTIEFPYLTVSSKPQIVKLALSQEGTDRFRVGGLSYKATRYVVHVKLGGVSGALAPILGQQPADYRIWVSQSPVPSAVRADGPFFNGGPIWSMQLATPTW